MKKILMFINKMIEYVLDALIVIIIAIFVGLLICMSTKIMYINYISGTSMEPTFCDGEYVISTTLYEEIKPSDVVIVYEGENNVEIIKRVVATPNQTLTINNNSILIDGKNVNDAFSSNGNEYGLGEYRTGENEYFVLGDNRHVSKDSRVIGMINKDKIKSIVFFRIKFENYKPKIELIH